MAAASYRIIDEPAASPLSRAIVNPFLIVLAGMLLPLLLGSAMRYPQLLALLWFALNGIALRGPTLRQELAWIIGGAAFLLGFLPAFRLAMQADLLSVSTVVAYGPYIAIARSAIILTVLYRLYVLQNDSYQLHRYLHGDRA